jgi:hypothetical protein
VAVTVSAAGNYVNMLGGLFGHVEIEMINGPAGTVELADNSTVTMTEFGLLVAQPGAAPNQFIPWSSVRRIVEAPVPPASVPPAPDDGQAHD